MTEYNKVVYDGQTLIDLTQDDVQASDVRNGVYFHSADGVRSQGTMPTPTDYVVEQGTSNGWTYRKWNSGIAECWSKQTVSVNFSQVITSNFRMTNTATSVSYPDIFISITDVLCSASHNTNNTWLTMVSGRADTTNKNIDYGFMGWNTGGTQSVIISINIKGTWK